MINTDKYAFTFIILELIYVINRGGLAIFFVPGNIKQA